MRRWLIALIALLVVAFPAWATPEPVASVTVNRSGRSWTADYSLNERAPVWVFAKSILPRESTKSWRIGSVRVLTPGVKLRRLGNFDALVAEKGRVPKKVRLTFSPYVEDIEAGYDSALAFADGSVALYTGQFKVVPMKSVGAARQAPQEDSKLPAFEHPTLMTFADRSGAVLAHGKRLTHATLRNDDETYVLFGRAKPVIGPAMTTIIDPALPKWMADYLNSELPRILDRYKQQLGPSPVGQPTLLVSWAGPEREHISLSGSVLTSMVIMTFKGDAILKPNEQVSHYARWFVSHEAAHFWLGQAVHYGDPSESWITEGGAELLAFRATAAADPTFDVKARLTQAKEECIPFLGHGGVSAAYEREGDFRAYYACGAILALAAEKASNGDFPDFVRTLIARYGADETITRSEWLALLDSRSPGLSDAVAELLDHKQSEPTATLDRFIATAGISGEFKPKKSPK